MQNNAYCTKKESGLSNKSMLLASHQRGICCSGGGALYIGRDLYQRFGLEAACLRRARQDGMQARRTPASQWVAQHPLPRPHLQGMCETAPQLLHTGVGVLWRRADGHRQNFSLLAKQTVINSKNTAILKSDFRHFGIATFADLSLLSVACQFFDCIHNSSQAFDIFFLKDFNASLCHTCFSEQQGIYFKIQIIL